MLLVDLAVYTIISTNFTIYLFSYKAWHIQHFWGWYQYKYFGQITKHRLIVFFIIIICIFYINQDKHFVKGELFKKYYQHKYKIFCCKINLSLLTVFTLCSIILKIHLILTYCTFFVFTYTGKGITAYSLPGWPMDSLVTLYLKRASVMHYHTYTHTHTHIHTQSLISFPFLLGY